jgi:hypothetical protein
MTKKPGKKLLLKKEVVRELAKEELKDAAGGGTVLTCASCPTLSRIQSGSLSTSNTGSAFCSGSGFIPPLSY